MPDVLRERPKRHHPCLWRRLLPGLPGRASGVERQKLKSLQLKLGRGKDAQDLLMQTARERGLMFCSLVSNTNGPKTLSVNRMHQGGPASLFVALICLGDFLESDAGFVWVEVLSVCVYSCCWAVPHRG